ncbi:MAG: bifunctional pyr operon transcriptional regulator/uracil phosphoribosyltransferase PyrR [Planctomycetota bacterium]
MSEKRYDAAWIHATLKRLAEEVLADLAPGRRFAVVGIRTRGAVLARRLADLLLARGVPLEFGQIDSTLYRDDIASGGGRKAIRASDIPFDLTGAHILLVDDVLSTGRTIRAAITELMDFGRPAAIRLLCLIDRGGRELPIQPDFLGASVTVKDDRKLQLHVTEIDGADEIVLENGA